MRIYFTFFLVLILIAIAFIFGSQNEQIISLNYLVAKVDLSVAPSTFGGPTVDLAFATLPSPVVFGFGLCQLNCVVHMGWFAVC